MFYKSPSQTWFFFLTISVSTTLCNCIVAVTQFFLNPIENLWHELKTFLRTKIRPKTKDELVNGIGKFWNELDKARCGRYIDHLKKVFPAVVAREGLASGY